VQELLVLVSGIVADLLGEAVPLQDILELTDWVEDAVPDFEDATVRVEEVVADIVLELLTDSDEVGVCPIVFDGWGEREMLGDAEDVLEGFTDLDSVGEDEVVLEELMDPVMVVEEVVLFVGFDDAVIDLVIGGVLLILGEEVVVLL